MGTAKKPPSVLSLCSGYGGLEIGLERALGKINILTYVEIEAFAIANLVDKMEKGQLVPTPIWTDIKTLPLGPFRDRVDILTGGYPCQPFSAAGRRKGEDDPRHLFPAIKRIIAGVRPVWCFFENVEGHISLGLSTVISDLEEMGYETTWGVFSAAEVGAPHQRKRVFIVAHPTQQLPHRTRNTGQGRREEYSDGGADAANTGNQGLPQPEQQTICRSRRGQEGRTITQCHGPWSEPWIEAATRLCRVDDGAAGGQDPNRDRTDRLGLLGNGVVPQTAEKAFRILMRRFLR